MTAPALTQAIPSISHPLVDRHRNISPVWYPFLQKLAQFIDGIANGELIVDGVITAEKLEAGVIDADAIAADILVADFITAESGYIADAAIENAAIASAAVDTLQIAGNAVTQAVSVTVPTSGGISSTSFQTVASTVMAVSGTQPILVWGAFLAAGARTPGTDFTYDGLTWNTNTAPTFVDARVVIGTDAGELQEAITIQPNVATNIPFASVFSGVSAGNKTVALQIRKVSGFENFGYRDVTLAALETKR